MPPGVVVEKSIPLKNNPWRFKCGGGPLELEQATLNGDVHDFPVHFLDWNHAVCILHLQVYFVIQSLSFRMSFKGVHPPPPS